jgi:hypothetical protein
MQRPAASVASSLKTPGLHKRPALGLTSPPGVATPAASSASLSSGGGSLGLHSRTPGSLGMAGRTGGRLGVGLSSSSPGGGAAAGAGRSAGGLGLGEELEVQILGLER